MAEQANDAPVIMGSLTRDAYLADDEAKNPPAASWLVVKEKDDDLEGKPNAYTGSWDMLLPDQANAGLGQSNVFTASDEDARGQIFWSLRGEDADQFVRSQTEFRDLTGLKGPDEPIAIRFKDAPDYENPTDANRDGYYKVTVVATDSAGAEDTRDLTVWVYNVEEAGEATLSTPQPLIGQPITADVKRSR